MYFKAINSALAFALLLVTTSVVAEPLAARQEGTPCKFKTKSHHSS